MSIKLVKESPDMYANTHVYEKCHFCGVETKYWHKATNTPICKQCGEVKDIADIKKGGVQE